MVIEGKQRIGKTSYVSQGMAEAHGEWSYNPFRECVKKEFGQEMRKWITFPPEEFLDVILDVGITEKHRAILWDDAGFWLFVLDWYDPFVKTVAKYIQLAGRQFGCVLFTTPSQKLMSGKVLDAMPDLLVCKVVHDWEKGEDTGKVRPRLASIYERWDYPDGKKGGVRKRWRDRFNAILPDEYFAWYQPKSQHYLDEAMQILKAERQIMRLKLEKRASAAEEAKKQESNLQEAIIKVAGSEERLKEVDEVIKQLSDVKNDKA